MIIKNACVVKTKDIVTYNPASYFSRIYQVYEAVITIKLTSDRTIMRVRAQARLNRAPVNRQEKPPLSPVPLPGKPPDACDGTGPAGFFPATDLPSVALSQKGAALRWSGPGGSNAPGKYHRCLQSKVAPARLFRACGPAATPLAPYGH